MNGSDDIHDFSSRALPVILIVPGVLLCLHFLCFSFVGNDGYFHIRYAEILGRGEATPFRWLPYTIYRDFFPDHHLLFHYFLIPFTWFGNLDVSARIAAAVSGSIPLIGFWYLLRSFEVKRPALWLGLAASVGPWLERMQMIRVQAIACAGLFAGLVLLRRKSWYGLTFLALLFAYWYNGVFYLLVLAAVFAVCQPGWTARERVVAVLTVAGAIVAATVVNPTFPENTEYLTGYMSERLSPALPVAIGVEWKSLQIKHLKFLVIPVICLCGTAVLLIHRWDELKRHSPLYVFTLLLVLLTVKHARFVEYSVPFTVLCFAVSLLPEYCEPRLREFLFSRGGRRTEFAVLCLGLLTGGMIVFGVNSAAKHGSGEACGWLRQHAPPGAIVYNQCFGDFPPLFYFAPEFRYVTGLDPKYLAKGDPARFDRWVEIGYTDLPDPGRIIRDVFDAEWIVTLKTGKDESVRAYIARLSEDPCLEVAFEDHWSIVHHFVAEKNETPGLLSPGSNAAVTE